MAARTPQPEFGCRRLLERLAQRLAEPGQCGQWPDPPILTPIGPARERVQPSRASGHRLRIKVAPTDTEGRRADEPQALGFVLTFGGAARVLEPLELQSAVLAAAREIVDREKS